MDLSAFQTEVKARGGDALSNSRLTTFINFAKNALEDIAPWPWLEANTTGTAPLTVSDLKAVLFVVDTTNDNPLTGLDRRDVRDLDAKLDQTGSPEVWWLDGAATLKVWPLNTTASLSVDYVKFSPELSAGTDTPLVPVRYHPVIADLAVVEIYKDSDNPQSAAALQADVDRRVAQMVDVYFGRNRQGPDFQAVRFYSEDW